MKQYLNDYRNLLKIERNLSDNTVISYLNDINQFLDYCEECNIDAISTAGIRQFLYNIRELSAKTRKRKLASIRSFMKYLKKNSYIQINPSLEIDSPKIEKKLPVVISQTEVTGILDSNMSNQDRAILETLYGTGCRISELTNLKIDDIDFENMTVLIFGKGNKQRLIPINNASISAIKTHLQTRGYDSDYVFASRDFPSKPMTTRNARNRVYKYTEGKYSPHKFRHSYATHMHARGASINHIKDLLGHEDISTTTIYTHVGTQQLSSTYRAFHPRG